MSAQPGGSAANFRLSGLPRAAMAAMLLAGCAPALELDSGAAADFQRCGVDIQMSSAFRVELMNDASDKRLSVATLNELRSTIFDQVPPANKLAVYQSYVDCITSRHALNAALADLADRKVALAARLRDKYRISGEEIGKIQAFYDREADQLRGGQLIAARQTRAAMIYELASMAARHNIELDEDDIISTGGGGRSAAALAAERADFLSACLAAADETLCRSMVPVYDRYKSGRPPP
jgi:hypothetical protein